MNVLLHVDDSRHWHPAARLARPLVEASAGTITLFSSQWSRVKREKAFAEGERVLDLPASRIRRRERAGIAEVVIPEEARDGDYDLVAVGRLGTLDRVTNGLVAHLLVGLTPANILLARGQPTRLDRILLASGGAPETLELTRAASQIAHAHGARLTLLHVVSQFALTEESARHVDALVRDFPNVDIPEAHALVRAATAARGAGIDVNVIARAGLVVDEIVESVREGNHDLVVLGSHRNKGRDRLLQEDLAGLLVRSVPASVLVVKHAGDRFAPPGWPGTA